MSKFYKVFILLLLLGGFANAQNTLEIYDLAGNKFESGSKQYVFADGGSTKILYTDSLIVKSVHSDFLKIKVRKTEELVVNGTTNSFRALAQDVTGTETTTPFFVSLNPGETLPESQTLVGSYFHRGKKGTTIITYSYLAYDIAEELIDSVFVKYYFKNTSIIIYDEQYQLFPRGEILISGDPDGVVEFPIHLYNQFSSPINLKATKIILNEEENHEVYFKFGNVEYGVEEYESSNNGVAIPSGEFLDDENKFIALFNANGTDSNTELTKVRYLFNDLLNVADSNSITLVFNPSGVGFEDLEQYQISAPYPNPTNKSFTIDHPDLKSSNAELKIYNIQGQLIFKKEINTTEMKTNIRVESFSPGTYFVSMELDGKPIGIEKLVIQ